ncbi:hypothetical protein AWH56_018885 [Anaerobacillus isosaccharinicus]|uniref:Uncharacterized protein n=1 Tax=Anaerobacillus isosaccharinicus TaxID=1532552 RepID=A0A1S2MD03_9BACI|nr:hypothetical protein [Anaerobacillus isosaccharinicus]MBA5587028.1 hypothetical protein [Anaerobacillus isosaccharinicus]QOY34772.1 hypothetical protein AWH56_018885 [Anaerobacillus isosaccharinicus]
MYRYQLFQLKELIPAYRVIFSPTVLKQKLKFYQENRNEFELVVFPKSNNEILLVEGYDLYFTLINTLKDTDVLCKVGDYTSEVEAYFATLRELLHQRNGRWAIKMNLFTMLTNTFHQDIKEIAKSLGIPQEKVSNYLLHPDIPPNIKIKACKYETARLANKIASSRLDSRFKHILFEFVTYPPKHRLRISDRALEICNYLINNNKDNLYFLSNEDVKSLIIRYCLEFKNSLNEEFRRDVLALKKGWTG